MHDFHFNKFSITVDSQAIALTHSCLPELACFTQRKYVADSCLLPIRRRLRRWGGWWQQRFEKAPVCSYLTQQARQIVHLPRKSKGLSLYPCSRFAASRASTAKSLSASLSAVFLLLRQLH